MSRFDVTFTLLFLFLRAHANFGARADSPASIYIFFEAPFEISSHGYERRDPGLHSLSLCTPEN